MIIVTYLCCVLPSSSAVKLIVNDELYFVIKSLHIFDVHSQISQGQVIFQR